MRGSFFEVDSDESSWNSEKVFEDGNIGHRPSVKGGYFPVPPVDSLQDLRSAMCLVMEQMGLPVEVHHHEVATAGQCEIGTRFDTLVRRADTLQILKYCVHNVANSFGKTATFMPKPLVGDNGNGMHVHQSLSKGGENIFSGGRLRRSLGDGAALHRRHHQARARAECVHERVDEQLTSGSCPDSRPPTLLAYSARNRSASIRVPWVSSPKARRIEVRFPDSSGNPYFAFTAMMMAGIDGILNKIDPGSAMDKDLYDLDPEEEKGIPTVCYALDQALGALDADREFLKSGGRVLRRLHRRVHRPQDGGSDAAPDDDPSGRVRPVLQRLIAFDDARPRITFRGRARVLLWRLTCLSILSPCASPPILILLAYAPLAAAEIYRWTTMPGTSCSRIRRAPARTSSSSRSRRSFRPDRNPRRATRRRPEPSRGRTSGSRSRTRRTRRRSAKRSRT